MVNFEDDMYESDNTNNYNHGLMPFDPAQAQNYRKLSNKNYNKLFRSLRPYSEEYDEDIYDNKMEYCYDVFNLEYYQEDWR